jgi:thioredoxin reductase (NADPH)
MSPQDLHAVAFPRLDEAQFATLARCAGASLNRYPDGHYLFRVGQRDFKFFVVKSGELELVDESADTPWRIALLRRGEFTGDVAHLTGGASLISAVARGDCEVNEVGADALRRILNQSPALGASA